LHKTEQQAVVTVTDTGHGIPAHMLERIFELFAQVESTPQHPQGGLGIGLAVVKRIVAMHEGTVSAESAGLGQGSTFTVRIPLDHRPAAVDPRQASADHPPTAPRRILVADDNVDAAETLAILLESLGHAVHKVHDGEAAVEAAAAFDPELVLLDIGMPRVNGYDACRRIRSQAGGAARTLVAVTGWGQPQDQLRAREAGFDRHLVKPLDMEQLMQLISTRLEGSAPART